MSKRLDQVIFLLDQTSRLAKAYLRRELDLLKIGLTVEQWVLLKIIHENEGLSQVDLAARSLHDPAAITRTLDLLEIKKLIMPQKVYLSKIGSKEYNS